MSTPAVALRELTKTFGKHPALRGIDLTVDAAQVFGVIGPNGAGKTTTMRILLDIVRPTSGQVEVLGQDPRRGGRALRREIGYLPGELPLASRLTGRQLLRHFGRISGATPDTRMTELADRLNLDLNRPVRTLSKGNKQKVALIQAMQHSPPLLVLDEPTSGLDPLAQRTVHTLIREAAGRGQTIFLSSHVLSEVQETATDVAILAAGRILAISSVSALRAGARRQVSARVIGSASELGEALSRVPGVTELQLKEVGRPGLPTTSLSLRQLGDPDGLVKALAAFTLIDLIIREPDLEQVVIGMYGGQETPTASHRHAHLDRSRKPR